MNFKNSRHIGIATSNKIGPKKVSVKFAHAIDVHVGGKTRTLRCERRLTQTALAKKIGVTFQQIQKYEKGSTRVGVSRLHAIAMALGVDVKTLVCDLPQVPTDEFPLSRGTGTAAFAATTEGARLIAAFRMLPKQPRRMTLDMVTALAKCFANGAVEDEPAKADA